MSVSLFFFFCLPCTMFIYSLPPPTQLSKQCNNVESLGWKQDWVVMWCERNRVVCLYTFISFQFMPRRSFCTAFSIVIYKTGLSVKWALFWTCMHYVADWFFWLWQENHNHCWKDTCFQVLWCLCFRFCGFWHYKVGDNVARKQLKKMLIFAMLCLWCSQWHVMLYKLYLCHTLLCH